MEEEFWKGDDELSCLREFFMADFCPGKFIFIHNALY